MPHTNEKPSRPAWGWVPPAPELSRPKPAWASLGRHLNSKCQVEIIVRLVPAWAGSGHDLNSAIMAELRSGWPEPAQVSVPGWPEPAQVSDPGRLEPAQIIEFIAAFFSLVTQAGLDCDLWKICTLTWASLSHLEKLIAALLFIFCVKLYSTTIKYETYECRLVNT